MKRGSAHGPPPGHTLDSGLLPGTEAACGQGQGQPGSSVVQGSGAGLVGFASPSPFLSLLPPFCPPGSLGASLLVQVSGAGGWGEGREQLKLASEGRQVLISWQRNLW